MESTVVEHAEVGEELATSSTSPEMILPALARFREIVKAACSRSANLEEIEAEVKAALAADAAMREELRDEAEHRLVKFLINEVRHKTLEKVKHRPCAYTFDAMAQTADSLEKSILDTWKLPIGKLLGDATGAEMTLLATNEEKLAHGHTLNAKFFARLAEMTPSDVKVRVAVRSADDLWARIKNK